MATAPAFEELVRRYEKELYGYLRHYLGDVQMAEDVFQQTFLQVHLKCGQFECERKLRPWLYAVATNQAIDFQRRNGRHRTVSLDRRIGGTEEDESGTAGRFVRQPGPKPGRGKPVVRTAGGRPPRRRGVAGTDEASGDVGVLPRIEVSRGGRSVVHSRGHGEEPHPRGDREADGIAGIRSMSDSAARTSARLSARGVGRRRDGAGAIAAGVGPRVPSRIPRPPRGIGADRGRRGRNTSLRRDWRSGRARWSLPRASRRRGVRRAARRSALSGSRPVGAAVPAGSTRRSPRRCFSWRRR